MATMRIGVLPGGGDCPGLNAVIRAVTRRALDRGDEVVGILHGWRGLIDGTTRPLGTRDISGILPRGGTILRTSRTNPFKVEGGLEATLAALAELDALVAIGGEDTLGVAARLYAAPRRDGGRRPQDHRQRPLRHRLHVRVRHGAFDRDRGHRPAALDRRVA